MKMELAVSQALTWARIVERAFHDPGPWTFKTASGVTPAHRVKDPVRSEIVFTGMVSPSPDGFVELCSQNEMVTVAQADLTRGEAITWRLSLREHLRAS
jgi:hypothetical protein